VIHDADRSLEAWLASTLPPEAGVRFDAPDPAWARRPPERPFVDAFLFDVAEDVDGLSADSALIRDPGGHAVAWQPPVRRYRLSYLLTAWSADVPADHELLGSVLAGCAAAAIIPPDCLRGSLLEAGLPVELRCAQPRGTDGSQGAAGAATAGTAGLCQALGVPPRAALTLVVVAPVVPAAIVGVAPPARSLDLNMAATVPGSAVAPPGSAPGGQPLPSGPGQRRRWERARITERPG
jgi:Pvc16 N-terminal domain